jgi:hypothetical protein
MRFEVSTAVGMMMMMMMMPILFWILALCRAVGSYQRLREIYSLHLQGLGFTLKMETLCFSETSASTDGSARL